MAILEIEECMAHFEKVHGIFDLLQDYIALDTHREDAFAASD
jgi:hypothetical protein